MNTVPLNKNHIPYRQLNYFSTYRPTIKLASRVPFDERGNPDIKIEDISTLLLREYLVKVGSKLAVELYTKPLENILEQMDLYVGPKENRMLRNVAAMMFCEDPSKFFKRTQVEVVYFPEGRLNNPNNLYEGPVIKFHHSDN
ncbi:hypothetical protein [uncultured Bacteroides sp.]|uniref:hypothetical protein n=1 Tax=uncultured Bacteroides sp. TaxID=162156 RepID=UPI0026398C42|nr:hypothetical protein [uncultured Bacteroides sp.]